MARLSDIIEVMIRSMLEENQGLVEIARNDLANKLNCVPSQINYVISTRFTNEQGYYVESKRGGGGGIKITKIPMTSSDTYILHLLSSMENELSLHKVSLYLKELENYKYITRKEGVLIESILSDKVFVDISPQERAKLRSRMLKNLLARLMVQK